MNRDADQRLALAFLHQACDRAGFDLVYEFRCHPVRRWRLDLAVPAVKVGIEIHGGGYMRGKDGQLGGAHHRASGRQRDMEKLREATRLGWRIGEFNWDEVFSGAARDWAIDVCRRCHGSGTR